MNTPQFIGFIFSLALLAISAAAGSFVKTEINANEIKNLKEFVIEERENRKKLHAKVDKTNELLIRYLKEKR